MYLKFLAANGKIFPNSVFKIGDETRILDLKERLGKIVNISAQNISIKYLETPLEDVGLLSRAAQRCLAFGVVPTSDEYHKVDLLAYDEDKLVGWLRVLESGESRQSIVMDSVCSATSLSRWTTYTVRDSKIQVVGMDAQCSAGDDGTQSGSDGSIGSSLDGSKSNAVATRPFNPDDDPVGNTGCRERCCVFDPDRPMYTQVMPENRQFGVVIERGLSDCFKEDRILELLSNHLKGSEEAKKLFFSICSPVIPMEDAVMVIGGDADTRDWILRTIRPMCPPYVATEFTKYFNLVRYCFTAPLPARWSLCRIFRRFEQQNCPLDTSKWVVMSSVIHEICSENFMEKAVDPAFPNMEAVVYIDPESEALISNNCNKVNFVVWKLPFKPCSSFC